MTQVSTGKPAPEGLGGWLTLWGIGMIISLVVIVILMVQNAQSGDSMGIIFSMAYLAATIFLIHLYFAKRKAFPRLAITYMVCNAILMLLAFVMGDSTLRTALSACVQAAIWIPYLLLSKRVKATFKNAGLLPFTGGTGAQSENR